jgi:hypothetical protein
MSCENEKNLRSMYHSPAAVSSPATAAGAKCRVFDREITDESRRGLTGISEKRWTTRKKDSLSRQKYPPGRALQGFTGGSKLV